ncbi:restriction endonuclease subunit S [Thermus sediminis]|uniref:restriction endonuclease subunit S n=1 Tax=Thermus sediminis TaxID=1761908 RepID=UPI0018E4F22D|nr:restriction endonuclease subunit S [Thermus sediminis]
MAKIFSGSPAPQGREYFEQGKFPFVRVQDLGRHGITTDLKETADRVNERAVEELPLVKAPKGAILFPKSGAAILTNSRAVLGVDAYIVSHLAAVSPDPGVDSLWIFYWLRTIDMSEYVDNPAYPSLRLSKIKQIALPLPPLEEQRRIVARIEELMGRVREARRLRQEAQRDAERLWQSVLAHTFPRPGSALPEGWRWVRLGEVAKIFSGSPAPQGREYFEQGKFPFVRVQDLGRHGITTDLKETADRVNERAVEELPLVKAPKGAILFPKSGAAILTNSRAVLGVDAYIVSHLAAVSPDPGVDSLWIFYWLRTIDMSEYVDNPAYPSLRLSKIKQIALPLPPLEEQRRIVARIEAVWGKLHALKEAQAETDQELGCLEQAILDKAFRGEL